MKEEFRNKAWPVQENRTESMGARTAEYGRSKVTERDRNEVGVLEIVQFLTGCLAFFGKDLLFLHLFFKIRPALSSVLRCSQSEKRRKYGRLEGRVYPRNPPPLYNIYMPRKMGEKAYAPRRAPQCPCPILINKQTTQKTQRYEHIL